jgi:hypothetical protein
MDLEMERLGSGHCRFLGARERRGDQVDNPGTLAGADGKVLGQHAGHLPAPLGEMEFRQPAVQDAIGIMDLAMAKQMDSCLGHVYQFLKEAGRSEIFYR